jgi:ABC-type amino acid transport substrate-binding protein
MIGTRTTSTGSTSTGTTSTGARNTWPRSIAIVGLLAVAATSVAIGAMAASAMTSPPPRGGDFGVVVAGSSAAPSPTPSARASSAPTSSPSSEPVESEKPGRDAIPLTVDLVNETDDAVYVDIADNSGLLVDAVSGVPHDGVSVESYTLKVENIDARTLRLTWSDYAIPNALALYIDESARRFTLVQPEPKGDVDAMAHDRVLILTFSEPISAEDIEAILQDGLDV